MNTEQTVTLESDTVDDAHDLIDTDADQANTSTEKTPACDDTPPPNCRQRIRRSIPRKRPRFASAMLVAVTVAAVTSVPVIYHTLYQPDQQTGPAAATAAIQAASTGAAAVLSYSPDTVDRDVSTAESHLTGEFLTYYTQFARDIVVPAAKRKGAQAAAKVVRAAVAEIHPRSAVVLVFINQTTSSNERPDLEVTASSVKVTLDKANNTWLMSKFEPV